MEDGRAAVDAARTSPPDLVLCDVMMRRLDGFGVVQALRDEPATADLPIILLSARAGEQEAIAGLEAGADDYLVKPFSARELLARVEGALRLAKLRGRDGPRRCARPMKSWRRASPPEPASGTAAGRSAAT